jgi:membrane protein required for colicin V production
MDTSWLDIVILIVMALSVLSAVRKGFSREVIGLAASVFGLILGLWFYGSASVYFEPYVSSPEIAKFLGFGAVFLAVLSAGALLGWVVSRFLKKTGLSWVDRSLGAAFGIVRGLLFSLALVTIMVAFAPGSSAASPPSAVVQSRLAPYVMEASHVLTAIAPHDLKTEFQKRYDQVKQQWDQKSGSLQPRKD